MKSAFQPKSFAVHGDFEVAIDERQRSVVIKVPKVLNHAAAKPSRNQGRRMRSVDAGKHGSEIFPGRHLRFDEPWCAKASKDKEGRGKEYFERHRPVEVDTTK